MQNFAIAGGVLAGDPQVWFDSSTASVSFLAECDGYRGAPLIGTSQVVLSDDLSLSMLAKLQGDSSIVLSTTGRLERGTTIIGQANVQLAASGDFTRWVMVESLAPIELFMDGDILVVEPLSATFTIRLAATCEPHVSAARKVEGTAPIEFRGTLDGYHVKAARLDGYSSIEFASLGSGNLVMLSPPGTATIELRAAGDARFGGRVHLGGYAPMQLYSRGSLGILHYVYAEGTASIEVALRAEKAGIPAILETYVEAPGIRTLRVNEETRLFTVPAERRS